MNIKSPLRIACGLVTLLPLFSHAVTFDVRGGYKSASHIYESRFKVSQGWENGWWASMETDNKDNKNNGRGTNGTDKSDSSHSLGDITTDYNEIETNYTYKLNKKWSLQPGGILHWSTNGTQIRPYIRLNYKISDNLNSGLRYRYDYNDYETKNTDNELHRDSVNRLDLYLGYKINSTWSLNYQGTIYRHTSADYEYKNGKSWSTENAFTVRYKWNNTVSNYAEYDYQDKTGYYDGEGNKAESRYRIGITFNL